MRYEERKKIYVVYWLNVIGIALLCEYKFLSNFDHN